MRIDEDQGMITVVNVLHHVWERNFDAESCFVSLFLIIRKIVMISMLILTLVS